MKVSRRNVLWTIMAGATCLVFLIALTRHDGNLKIRPSSLAVNPSPSANNSPHKDTGARLDQDLAGRSEQSKREEGQFSPPPALERVPPPLDAATHQKIAAAMNAQMREETKRLYGAFFQQLHLSADLQEKVIDVLMQQQKQLEQQTFEAAQSGEFPTPPSPEAIRAQQIQQDQQLRSVLGDAGFAGFSQYRGTIPDRIIINDMNQQGANLSESQSKQLLQILTEARQQIIGQAGITQNLDFMSPDQAMTIIQQQEVLLQQTVGNRIQNLLRPEQAAALQGVFSQRSISPKGQ